MLLNSLRNWVKGSDAGGYWGVHHDSDEESRWGGPHSWAPSLHERQFSGSGTRTVGISLEGSLNGAQDGFEELTIVHMNSGLRLLM